MSTIDNGSMPTSKVPGPRGFAAWPPEKRREVSRKGGKAAHAAGTAHEFSSEEARSAGRLGGLAVHAKRAAASRETVRP